MGSRTYQGLSAGIFLIGLGALLLARIGIWPWILVGIGALGSALTRDAEGSPFAGARATAAPPRPTPHGAETQLLTAPAAEATEQQQESTPPSAGASA